MNLKCYLRGLWLDSLTNRVHKAAVHVGVEQVGHGQDGAVP